MNKPPGITDLWTAFSSVDVRTSPARTKAACLAFFGDASAAFTNMWCAVRRGGQLVLLSWQPLQRNEWISAFHTP